jgi:maltose O-acetyltransferase
VVGTVEAFKRRLLHRLRGEMSLERLIAQGLRVGRGVQIDRGVYLDAGHPWLIDIGEESVLSFGTIVLAHDASTRLHTGHTRIARVTIGPGVFVGPGAVILPGTRIGEGSIVGALAVVRGEVPPGSVIEGNPARVIADVTAADERGSLSGTSASVRYASRVLAD